MGLERDDFVLRTVKEHPGLQLMELADMWLNEHPEYYVRNFDPVIAARHQVAATLRSMVRYKMVERVGVKGHFRYILHEDD